MVETVQMHPKDVSSFGYEWTRYTGFEEDSRDLFEKTRTTPEFMRGKVILEAGCGNGRLVRLCASAKPKLIVGIDLSKSVNTAKANTMNYPNTEIIRASIFHLPFKENVFDYIYSVGVLHHTPDPRRAFTSLLPALKSGGYVAVWVYKRGNKLHYALIELLRKITTRIPHSIFYKMCWIQGPAGGFVNWLANYFPNAAKYIRIIFFISDKKTPEFRQLATFDWWTPKYMSFHSQKEVCGWFKENGLTDITVTSYSEKTDVGVKGMKSKE
ncbi:MAG: class I SAM-dependent methyltransferase [Candidatus Methanoperedens sp.]|nr:class I SAM-dependent methyltransferase [Candidatus Methanoperedens sp.]